MHTAPRSAATPAPRYPDPSRYRMRPGDGLAMGIVPFIDVLLILVTLLILLAAGGAGELRALPLAVPSAHGDAPKERIAAATYLVRADGVALLPPDAPPSASPQPVVLPAPDAIIDDGAVAMYCIEARLDPDVPVRVAAEPDSRHAQLVGFLSLAQRCGIRDVEVLVREDRLAVPAGP